MPKKPAKTNRTFFQISKTGETVRLFEAAAKLLAGPTGNPGPTDIVKTALSFIIKYYRWVIANHPDFNKGA